MNNQDYLAFPTRPNVNDKQVWESFLNKLEKIIDKNAEIYQQKKDKLHQVNPLDCINHNYEKLLRKEKKLLLNSQEQFERLFGDHYQTKLEKKNQIFNEKLGNLKRINLFEFSMFGIIRVVAVFDQMVNEKQVVILRKTNETNYEVVKIFDREMFLQKLSNLNIGEWQTTYRSELADMQSDGTNWNVELEFDQATSPKKKRYHGYVCQPDNYSDFRELLQAGQL